MTSNLKLFNQEQTDFISGLFNFEAPEKSLQDGIVDPAYIPTDILSFLPTKPFSSMNGRAVLRIPLEHACVITFNCLTETRENIIQLLKILTIEVNTFLVSEKRDLDNNAKGSFKTSSLIGFGYSFFVNDSGKYRFGFDKSIIPKGLNETHNHSDIYLSIECDNRSLLLEGVSNILNTISDIDHISDITHTLLHHRVDNRNMLGFLPITKDPGLESEPSSEDIALLSNSNDHPTQEYSINMDGSYLVNVSYQINSNSWRALRLSEKEAYIGTSQEEGVVLTNQLEGSLYDFAIYLGNRLSISRRFDWNKLSEARLCRGIITQEITTKPLQLYHKIFGRTKSLDTVRLFNDSIASNLSVNSYFIPNISVFNYAGELFFEPELLVLFEKGVRLYNLAEYELAIISFKEALSLSDSHSKIQKMLAMCYAELGLYHEALKQIQEATQLRKDGSIISYASWVYYLLHEYEKSIAFGEEAISLIPEETERSFAYHNIGNSLLQLGKRSAALNAFQQAARLVNLIPAHCYSYANALDSLDRERDAATIYDRTIEVVEWLINHNDVTRRFVRTNADLAFHQHQSQASHQCYQQVKELLIASRI